MDDRLRPHLDALLAEAGAAAAVGSWASARSLAEAALALDPTDAGARRHFELAEAALGAGERRQLTVMFCDVVGSTALSQSTDPELLREVLRSYRNVLDTVVARAEGQIALWIGDGALVYFGHPTPHEDDAWRAVHTGLALLAELDPVVRSAWADHRLDLAIRVAVHTGLIVRAEMGTQNAPDRDAIIGATPNLAARLQDKARPGTMLISEATHELVRGRFAVVPVGPFRLRGFSEPVSAFAVEFEVVMSSPVDLVSQRGSFVGRSGELATLQDRWEEVRGGASAAVFIVGEPGIGKTRLVAELRRHVVDDDGRVLEASCSSFHSATPLHPVRRLVEIAAGIDRRRPSERLGRLEAVLEASGFGHAAGALASQLGIDDGPTLSDAIAPEQSKERELALAALVAWIAAAAAERPLLLAVDDLQWIDPTSQEVLSAIIGRRPPGLFVVMTARTGTRSIWSEGSVPVMTLTPLPHREASALANDVAAGALSATVIDQLVQRCDGVPLFVEELVRSALVDDDALVSADHVVPASLRDPLLARLAAAGGDFALPQLVATIGDGAPLDLLRAVGGWSEAEVSTRLQASIAAGILVRDGEDHIRFRHHLLAELAYDTQLHRVRQDRHAATALVLAASPPRSSVTAGALAHHLERAGQPAPAIDYLLRAARDAQHKGAHAEALARLDHAMKLLDDVHDEGARLGLELLVREARHFSWASTLSSGSPAAAVDFARCVELLQTLPPRQEHDPAFVSVFAHLLMTGNLAAADELNHAGRDRFTDHGVTDVALPVDAGTCLTSFFAGDLRSSIEHGRRYLDSPGGKLDTPVPEGYPLPNELVSTVASVTGTALALSGEVDAGRSLLIGAESRAAALGLPHGPYSSAWTKALSAMAWFNLDDEEAFRRSIAEIRHLTVTHGMDSYSLVSNIQDAMGDVHFGHTSDAEHMSTMLTVWRFTGSDCWMPCFGSVAVDAHRRAGDHEAARNVAADVLDLAERTGVRYWNSPIIRMRGEIRLDDGDEGGAEDLLRAAAVAAQQGARLFELAARSALVRATAEAPAVKELDDLVRSFPDRVQFGALDEARRLLDEHGRG